MKICNINLCQGAFRGYAQRFGMHEMNSEGRSTHQPRVCGKFIATYVRVAVVYKLVELQKRIHDREL